jgi:hypothetical protein
LFQRTLAIDGTILLISIFSRLWLMEPTTDGKPLSIIHIAVHQYFFHGVKAMAGLDLEKDKLID